MNEEMHVKMFTYPEEDETRNDLLAAIDRVTVQGGVVYVVDDETGLRAAIVPVESALPLEGLG